MKFDSGEGLIQTKDKQGYSVLEYTYPSTSSEQLRHVNYLAGTAVGGYGKFATAYNDGNDNVQADQITVDNATRKRAMINSLNQGQGEMTTQRYLLPDCPLGAGQLYGKPGGEWQGSKYSVKNTVEPLALTGQVRWATKTITLPTPDGRGRQLDYPVFYLIWEFAIGGRTMLTGHSASTIPQDQDEFQDWATAHLHAS